TDLAGRHPVPPASFPGARILLQLAVEVAPQPEQLREGAHDHVQSRSRRAARRARKMTDWQLLHAEAEAPRLDQELRAERRAARIDGQARPHTPTEQLEGAVHVSRGVA